MDCAEADSMGSEEHTMQLFRVEERACIYTRKAGVYSCDPCHRNLFHAFLFENIHRFFEKKSDIGYPDELGGLQLGGQDSVWFPTAG